MKSECDLTGIETWKMHQWAGIPEKFLLLHLTYYCSYSPHGSLAQVSELNSNNSSQSSNGILVSCSEAHLGQQEAAAVPDMEASFSAMLPVGVNWSYHLFLIILHSSPVN